MKEFTDRYEKQQTWLEEDIYYLSKIEKILDVEAIVQTLKLRCICDCQMDHDSDVKLAFVRWFKAKIDHMSNDIYNVIEAEAKVFRINLPSL
ncbi:hypothetical protein [Microcoleus sp. D2_18a_D3]|uniref:hypothetical protein n=1 Tax=Microcoleus sp. D2_18a_D3 TaxID=3055330 RepID=UPI002FD413F5